MVLTVQLFLTADLTNSLLSAKLTVQRYMLGPKSKLSCVRIFELLGLFYFGPHLKDGWEQPFSRPWNDNMESGKITLLSFMKGVKKRFDVAEASFIANTAWCL